MDEEPESLEPVLDQFLRELARSSDIEGLIGSFVGRFPEITSLESELRNAAAFARAFDGDLESHARLSSIRCPHCGNQIRIVEDTPIEQEVICESCGSSVTVDADVTRVDPEAVVRSLGRYDLVAELGRGSFGVVYEAIDSELKRRVAIKVPRPGAFDSERETSRFLLEAQHAAQLSHPAIVPVYDVGRSEDSLFIVSEFIPGLSLSEILSGRRFAFRETAEMMAIVCDAIQYSHDNGIIHRDIKPGNILVDIQNRPHVTDFGLARQDSPGAITMTRDGDIIGTPAYMSPEQALGDQSCVDHRSDVYALGTTLYRMLSGDLPFRGSQRMLLHQVIHEDPKSIRKLNDTVPVDLEIIALKAMAKRPVDRYQSAAEVGADLTRWLNGDPIRARPPGRLERLWKWTQKRPVAAGLICSCVLLLMTGVLWALREHDLKIESLARDRATRERLSESYTRQGLASLNFRSTAESAQYFVESLAIDEALGNSSAAEHTRIRLRQHLSRIPPIVDLIEYEGDPKAVALTDQRLYVATERELLSFPIQSFRPEPRFAIDIPKTNSLYVSEATGRLLVLDADGTSAQLWDLTADRRIARLRHDAPLAGATLSADGTTIATFCINGIARVWNARDGVLIHDLEYGENQLIAGGGLSPSNSHLVTWHRSKIDASCQLHIRGLTPDILRTVDYTDVVVKCIEFPTAKSVLIGDSSGLVRHFDLEDAAEKHRLSHEDGLQALRILPTDSTKLLSLTNSGLTTLWDIDSELRLHQSDHPNAQSLGVSRDSTVYVVSGPELPLFIHWVTTGKTACDAISPRKSKVRLMPNNRQVVLLQKGCLEVRDLAGVEAELRFRHGAEIAGGRVFGLFSPDAKFVVGGNIRSSTVRLWKRKNQMPVADLTHESAVKDVRFSPNGKILATGTRGGIVALWDAVSGARIDEIKPRFDAEISRLEFFRDDDSKFVVGSSEGHVEIRSTDEPTAVLESWKLPTRVHSISFSPDLRFLHTSDKSRIVIRELRSMEDAIDSLNSNGRIRSGHFSQDARYLLIAGDELSLWDWQNRRIERSVKSRTPFHARFSTDSNFVSTAIDRDVAVFSINDFNVPKFTFPEPDARTAKFHPNRALLATAGGIDATGNGTANVWDLHFGVPAAPTFFHDGAVTDVQFSKDGRWLLTPSNDGLIHVWNLAPIEFPADALRLYLRLLCERNIESSTILTIRERLEAFRKLRADFPSLFSTDDEDRKRWQWRIPPFAGTSTE